LGGVVSGLTRLGSVEGFCKASAANAPVLLPGPWEFRLLDGDAARDGDSMRCFGPGGTGLKCRAGGCTAAAASARSSGAAIALRAVVEEWCWGFVGGCGTRGSNAPVA
jgi:hypothetical protein